MATNKSKAPAQSKTAAADPRTSTAPAVTPAPTPAAKAPADDEVKPRKRKEEMVTCTIPQGFQLTLDDGTTVDIKAGTDELPRSHAEHWYSKAHGVEIAE